MSQLLRALPVATGPAVLELLPTLAEALGGGGPAWLPVPADDAPETERLMEALAVDEPIEDDVALVMATSGSTGTPKGALLSASALRSSGEATHTYLGGAGSWLLALGADHVAGMQVLLRSVLAGTEPTVLNAGFRPCELADAIAAMPARRRYTSLAPTQLIRALDGVQVRLDDGRVLLGGATVASGYRNQREHPAFAERGWFRTDDAGMLADGVLSVLGRLDDAITTGGLTVLPQVVEAALATHPGVRECAVIGVADEQWGQRVVAVIVPGVPVPTLAELRHHVSTIAGTAAAPKQLHVIDILPLRGPGKIDRRALAQIVGAATLST